MIADALAISLGRCSVRQMPLADDTVDSLTPSVTITGRSAWSFRTRSLALPVGCERTHPRLTLSKTSPVARQSPLANVFSRSPVGGSK